MNCRPVIERYLFSHPPSGSNDYPLLPGAEQPWLCRRIYSLLRDCGNSSAETMEHLQSPVAPEIGHLVARQDLPSAV